MAINQAKSGIDHLEYLAMNDSPAHRLHPMSKLITTIIYIIAVISFMPYQVVGLMPFIFYPAVMTPLSGTPCKPLLKRFLVALPFSMMAGLSNLILLPNTAFNIGDFPVSFGMLSFSSVIIKTFLTIFAVLLLFATTSFVEINQSMIAIRIPGIICLTLVMVYRYITVLLNEAASMLTAYSLRSPWQSSNHGRRMKVKMKDMGFFLGILILRSFDRAERIYQAMKCRGFQNIYHGKKDIIFSLSDWIYTISLSLTIIALRIVGLCLK